jgi:hypothetical protein
MQIPILVEPIEGGRFRARAGEPFVLTAEGASGPEALQNLERMIGERLRSGAVLLSLEVPPSRRPSAAHGPIRYQDPEFDQWLANKKREEANETPPDEAANDEWFWRMMQEGIEEYRRKDDEELKRQEDAGSE